MRAVAAHHSGDDELGDDAVYREFAGELSRDKKGQSKVEACARLSPSKAFCVHP